MMVQTIRRRLFHVPALPWFMAAGVLLSACGGAAEAPRSPSSPPAAREEPTAPEAAEPPAPEDTEPPASDAEPTQLENSATPPKQLARELEKRREAAKAQSGGEQEEPIVEAEEAPTAAYTGPDPCRATSFSVDRVREACNNGGRPSAKRVMKDAITKAIAVSHRLVCTDCHVNQRDFKLKPNAVEDLKRWIEDDAGASGE